jgi:hypothetical protein
VVGVTGLVLLVEPGAVTDATLGARLDERHRVLRRPVVLAGGLGLVSSRGAELVPIGAATVVAQRQSVPPAKGKAAGSSPADGIAR